MTRWLVLVSLCFTGSACAQQPVADPFAKWEKEIVAIEKRLKDAPPKKGEVVFAGASSIRLWDLKKSFPNLAATNVGFGGSEIRDSTHFAVRIILPLEPSTIVFYAGDNDINNKRTPKQAQDDFTEFAQTIHAKLPKCRILFIAIKPSPSRWKLYDVQSKANESIRELSKRDERLGYINIVAPMLGEDGKPKAELFQKDELHLNEKGYVIWSDLVKRAIAAK